MKTIKVNPLKNNKGLLLRFSDRQPQENITNASLNYWLNNEFPVYLNQGYKIYYNSQFYDPIEKRFI